jgi:hypothetical protein
MSEKLAGRGTGPQLGPVRVAGFQLPVTAEGFAAVDG